MAQELDHLFSSSISEGYERYLVPVIFHPYAEDLAERVRVPEAGRVLEVAAGTGALTRELRKALPRSVQIVATDLNPPTRAASAKDFAVGFVLGSPLHNELKERGCDLNVAADRAEAALQKRFGAGAIRGKMRAHVFSGSAGNLSPLRRSAERLKSGVEHGDCSSVG